MGSPSRLVASPARGCLSPRLRPTRVRARLPASAGAGHTGHVDDSGTLLVSILLGASFVLGTVALVLGSYLLARRVLHPGQDGDGTAEVVAQVAVRVATLHSLVLGLVYAQELDAYKNLRATLSEEAVAIADVFNDAQRFGGVAMEPVQQGLARYIGLVVEEEWPMLASERRLSPEAWAQWEDVYERLLDLTPTTERERYLADRMRERISTVARFRQLREATSMDRFTVLFWLPALFGLVIVAMAFYIYRPTRTHLVLLSLLGTYSGVILFFIFAFGNPYAAPGKLEPRPFQALLAGEIGERRPPE
ncbi:DUF4239 domain-containing protein [Rubellimicrobium roseum]|uniref:DUF4239 domain-containing protein n=1 Tax=Rubellimicrobium roseum TaxID=687525 RepID=A0A5C4N7P9_9RHOB|nr:DUF4239 domain-containing protein [Rubellimicrobium roseum]TNC64509.1 DUF4239 domain-containing protein [Rubellimicrobium roseum]